MNVREVSPLRNKATFLGTVLLVASVVFLIGVSRFPDTAARYRSIAPSFFPNLLGTALAVLSVLLFIEGVRSAPAPVFDIQGEKGNGMKAGLLVVVLIVFVSLFRILGFGIVSFLLTATLQLLLGERRALRVTGVSLLVAGSLHLVFVVLLRVPLPVGLLFR